MPGKGLLLAKFPMNTPQYEENETKRIANIRRKLKVQKDLQSFLATHFPPKHSESFKFQRYDHVEVNGFIIQATYHIGRKQWVYKVISRSDFLNGKRNRVLSQPMLYTPSTGGKQKYKTVPRKI